MTKLRELSIDPSDYKVCKNCKCVYPSSFHDSYCTKCQRMLEQLRDCESAKDYEVVGL